LEHSRNKRNWRFIENPLLIFGRSGITLLGFTSAFSASPVTKGTDDVLHKDTDGLPRKKKTTVLN